MPVNMATFDYLFSTSTTKEDIKIACERAASYRLAVNTWCFFEIFRDVKLETEREYKVHRVAMAFSNVTGDPVGCGIVFEAWGDINAGCFVRATCRRQGIGSRIIEDLLFNYNFPVRIHDGIEGSKDFWKKMGANDLDYIKDKCPILKSN